jgi:hypothetical protein
MRKPRHRRVARRPWADHHAADRILAWPRCCRPGSVDRKHPLVAAAAGCTSNAVSGPDFVSALSAAPSRVVFLRMWNFSGAVRAALPLCGIRLVGGGVVHSGCVRRCNAWLSSHRAACDCARRPHWNPSATTRRSALSKPYSANYTVITGMGPPPQRRFKATQPATVIRDPRSRCINGHSVWSWNIRRPDHAAGVGP